MNGVAVAPHGPILCEDEATPSRKPFKYLPCPFWAFPDKKIIKKYKKFKKKTKNIYFHINSRSTALAAAMLSIAGFTNCNNNLLEVQVRPISLVATKQIT